MSESPFHYPKSIEEALAIPDDDMEFTVMTSALITDIMQRILRLEEK